MSDKATTPNVYGPATQLISKGAVAHVSPYRNVSHMTTNQFPRDIKGRFTGY
jgi:hypothetical protein